MDGVDLMGRLRAEPAFAQTPVVIASGLDVEEMALGAGANLFLVKPFEPNTLADTFYDLIG